MLIEVHHYKSNERISIEKKNIEYFVPQERFDCTSITLKGGKVLHVKETYTEVENLMRNVRQA